MRKLCRVICTCLTAVSVAMLLSACVKTVIKDDNPKGLNGRFRDKSLPLKKYKKLTDYKLFLYPVGDNTIVLDENATLKLRLRNVGTKKVKIDEWYMDVPYNIKLYYHPFDLKVNRFIAAEWTEVSPEIEKNARRFELELMPKNSVLIIKKLDFFKDLNLKPGETKKLFMVAELNLQSVKLRTNMFPINLKAK